MNEEKIEILLFFSNKYFFKSTFPIDSYDGATKIAKEIILNCNQNLNYIRIQKNGEEIGAVERFIKTADLRKPE